MRTHERPGPHTLHARRVIGIVVALGLAAAIAAGPSSAAHRGGTIKFNGTPALIDSNVGNGKGKHYFDAVIRISSTFRDVTNVKVGFDVMQRGKVVQTDDAEVGIRPGGGVVGTKFELLPKPNTAYVLRARFISFSPPDSTDGPLKTATIAGKPVLVDNDQLCSLKARIHNPAKAKLSAFDKLYIVGLLRGQIVVVGEGDLFDEVLPGGTRPFRFDYISCLTVDDVQAYVEGDTF